MVDLSGMDYEQAGVSITAQNDVNREIKRRLNEQGLAVEGLFGGAVDISHLKGNKTIPIGVVSSSMVEDGDIFTAGKKTVTATLEKINPSTEPLAMLDYYASPGMDVEEVPRFVEGVATAGLESKVPTIGGESAQMPGTYHEGQRDAYVSVIFQGDQGETIDLAERIDKMEQPLLCASTDGTGTKTRFVKDPRDIIYHGSNDLGAIGVQPIGFSLYVAGNVPQDELDRVVRKSQKICEELGIAALDATVEFKPDEYSFGEVDIAGTVIGVADKKTLISGEQVEAGDAIIGFAADCLMTNGYSLARKYVEMTEGDYNDPNLPELEGTTIQAELSKTHVPYTDILFGVGKTEGLLAKYKRQIKATAHVTGGGQQDNIERMVPEGLCASVQKEVLPLPPITQYFGAHGADEAAMYEAFNMGVGFSVTVPEEIAEEVVAYVNDNFRFSIMDVDRQAAKIGMIETGELKFKFV